VTEWTREDQEALRKLSDRLQRDPSFSEQDAEIIREMIAVYRGVRAWGRGARFLIIALAAVAAAVTAWETIWAKGQQWFGG